MGWQGVHATQPLPATGDADASLPLVLAFAGTLLVASGMRFRSLDTAA